MPLRTTLSAIAGIAAQAAVAATPTLDPETANRLRAFQEEQTYPLPSENEVDAAEKILASKACIGKLDKWNRHYARKVDWQNGHVDRNLLWFNFREAGLYGYRSGRKVGRLGDLTEIDDRQFRLVSRHIQPSKPGGEVRRLWLKLAQAKHKSRCGTPTLNGS